MRTLWIGFMVTLAVATTTLPASARSRGVRLTITQATAERTDHYTLFSCAAILTNATGRPLQVKSNFASAFDGLDLVVMTTDGRQLCRQPYIMHQSPYSFDGRWFTLQPGQNRQALAFPVPDMPPSLHKVKVMLTGILPGSDYHADITSKAVAVRLP